MTEGTLPPEWAAKAIAQVAKHRFAGYTPMFEHHGWPGGGSDMMRKVQTRVVISYGSVEAFEEHFNRDSSP